MEMPHESPTFFETFLDDWRDGYPQGARFVRDGAVNWDEWISQKTPKVLFLLKEAYTDEPDGFDLREYVRLWRKWKGTWQGVAIITKAIHDAAKGDILFDKRFLEEERGKILQSISIVNIKKVYGESKSCNDDLLCYARHDAEFISREIEMLEPNVVVCGGTRWLLEEVVRERGRKGNRGRIDSRAEGDSVGRWQDFLILDTYHPSAPVRRSMLYYSTAAMWLSANR